MWSRQNDAGRELKPGDLVVITQNAWLWVKHSDRDGFFALNSIKPAGNDDVIGLVIHKEHRNKVCFVLCLFDGSRIGLIRASDMERQ